MNRILFKALAWLLAAVLVAVILWKVAGVFDKKPEPDTPVGVVESLTKIDSLQKLLNVRDMQLGSNEAVTVSLYNKADSLTRVIKASKKDLAYYKSKYRSHKDTNNCDSLIQAYDTVTTKLQMRIENDSVIITRQKLSIAYLKDKVTYSDSTAAYWKRIADSHQVDYKALNYYRTFTTEHKFKSWLVGLRNR